jgi:esterase/lipase superfamily enzyme
MIAQADHTMDQQTASEEHLDAGEVQVAWHCCSGVGRVGVHELVADAADLCRRHEPLEIQVDNEPLSLRQSLRATGGHSCIRNTLEYYMFLCRL